MLVSSVYPCRNNVEVNLFQVHHFYGHWCRDWPVLAFDISFEPKNSICWQQFAVRIFHLKKCETKEICYRNLNLKWQRNEDTLTFRRNYLKVVRGLQPLNDISGQINAVVSFQVVMFIGETVLLAIYTILGFYKYYRLTASTLKNHLFMAVSTHVFITGQCVLNGLSTWHVSSRL